MMEHNEVRGAETHAAKDDQSLELALAIPLANYRGTANNLFYATGGDPITEEKRSKQLAKAYDDLLTAVARECAKARLEELSNVTMKDGRLYSVAGGRWLTLKERYEQLKGEL